MKTFENGRDNKTGQKQDWKEEQRQRQIWTKTE